MTTPTIASNNDPGDELPLALRAHIVQVPDDEEDAQRLKKKGRHRAPFEGWPATVLALDFETTTDATQRLLFGSYRFAKWLPNRTLYVLEEGLVYADDLPSRDRPACHVLLDYVDEVNAKDTGKKKRKPLKLMSRREFVDDVLWNAYRAQSLVLGFNLPFDLSRLAIDCGAGRGFYYGGFSLPVWQYEDEHGKTHWNPNRPRIEIRPIDSRRAFIGYSLAQRNAQEARTASGAIFRGRFLDLRTLTSALTDQSHSLASAGKAFRAAVVKGTSEGHGEITKEEIDYNRRDVAATLSLADAERAEYDRHPIGHDPCKAYSAASISKAYLRTMGVTPPLQQFPDFPAEVLGYAMVSYFGGRAECRIRREAVPIVYCDFLSMYPTVNTLLGLWKMLTAERLDVVDATEVTRQLLSSVTTDDVFKPEFWSSLNWFAEVDADDDLLPIRTQYDTYMAQFSIGVNRLVEGRSWYAGPDLVASTLLTGKAPNIVRAIRLVPSGQQPTLTPVELRSQIHIDPTTDDFFRRVIEKRREAKQDATIPEEERARLDKFLKVLANSGAYGLFAEVNEELLRVKERTTIRVHGRDKPFEVSTKYPDELGEYCFPPLAALITAAARLMLALLERRVKDAGGTYAFCDTDSMAIVATENGGGVTSLRTGEELEGLAALSWSAVDEIVRRFEQLNPYDNALVPGSILKVEDDNFADGGRTTREQLYAFAISAKRYATFNLIDGGVTLRKASEHGLGHLLDPISLDARREREDNETDAPEWIETIWHILVAEALGRTVQPPSWLHRPAVSRVAITSVDVLERFGGMRRDRWYDRRMKPFNFLLSVHIAQMGHSSDVDPTKCHLFAPFELDPEQWLQMEWTDRATGSTYPIRASGTRADDSMRVKSYRDVLDEYRVHAEPKSTNADGRPCARDTIGLLSRRAIRAAGVLYVSKEAKRIDEVTAGLVHELAEVQDIYIDPAHDPWDEHWREKLKKVPSQFLAAQAQVSKRTIRNIRNGHKGPAAETAERLRDAVREYEGRPQYKGRYIPATEDSTEDSDTPRQRYHGVYIPTKDADS